MNNKLENALSRSRGRIMTLSIGNDQKKSNYAAKVLRVTPQYLTFLDTSSSETKRVSKSRIRGLRSGSTRYGRIR